jgi:P-type Cu+ transporter
MVTDVHHVAGQAPTSSVLSIAVDGMTCAACATRIERRLNALPGVEATVNFASERARVRAPADVSTRVLLEQIESIGYTAEIVEDESTSSAQAIEADRRVHSIGRRLAVASILFMPLGDASIAFWLVPSIRFPGWQWVLVVMAAPVLTYCAWPFYGAAIRAARHGTATMDTLVSIGILAAMSWSLYAMFWVDTGNARLSVLDVIEHRASGAIYIDVAAGVTTFLLAGRFFEALFRRRAGDGLRALAKVAAKHASILDNEGIEHLMPACQLLVGDRFVVRPGETIATDGEVILGHSSIDRSAMTGESLPIDAESGMQVLGGTVCVDGRLVVRATKVGEETQLANMVRLVEEAQSEKADVQRLADRISGVFVPAVLVIALATLVGWLLADGSPEQAFNACLCVLIIACPCALGLATPTALVVASGRGASLGIFFKGYQALEASRQVDTVVLDKTGTLTNGEMTVASVEPVAGIDRSTVLGWAGALERASEHLVGQALAAIAEAECGSLAQVDHFIALPGLGARGIVEGHAIAVGRAALFARAGVEIPEVLAEKCATWEELGRTCVIVGRDEAIVGAIALSDTLRPSATEAVRQLQGLDLHCVLLTGDNEAAARAIGHSLGVTDVVAGALPDEKVEVIRALQAAGHSVAMVGDGVNDGPALARANLGLAVGSGTDVAINAADLVIVRDDLRVCATAIDLSRRTISTIRGNLLWAFGYNVAAIPLAASGLLNPLIAAAAMALSSGFVLWNSSRLRHVGAVGTPSHDVGDSEAATLTLDGQPSGGSAILEQTPVVTGQ